MLRIVMGKKVAEVNLFMCTRISLISDTWRINTRFAIRMIVFFDYHYRQVSFSHPLGCSEIQLRKRGDLNKPS